MEWTEGYSARHQHRLIPLAIGVTLSVLSGSHFGCSSAPEEPQTRKILPKAKWAGVPGGITFGVGASSSFQNGWEDDIAAAWDDAWGVWDQGNIQWNGRWAYNLDGGQGWWEQPSGYSDNVDSVEFFFASTHGGAWLPDYNPDTAHPAWGVYSMWNQGKHALTNNMYLGYSRGFFTKSCDTHKNDGFMNDRWFPVFSGGLPIATGASGVVYDDTWYTSDSGMKFVDFIQNNVTFANAWMVSIGVNFVTQYPSVIASGMLPHDPNHPELTCNTRLYNLTQAGAMDTDYWYLPPWLVGELCAYQIAD
jgi:hypothetical protein